jgi:hypothetical protein
MATLDVYSANLTISGGGLIATPATASISMARTSLGRSSGKRIWTAMITTQPPAGEQPFGFGFCTASAPTEGITSVPGQVNDTGVTILPIWKYIFSNAMYRVYNQTNHFYILTLPRAIAFAIDLDAQRWWYCIYDPDTMIAAIDWSYDPGTAIDPAIADPTLATGADYGAWVDDTTIYPFVYTEQTGYSMAVNLDPAPGDVPCGIPVGYTGWGDLGLSNGALSAIDPVETLNGSGGTPLWVTQRKFAQLF